LYILGLPTSLTQDVKFWNPILIAAFSGCLFLFSQAFLPPGLHDYHLTSLNLTKDYEFDSTTAKPGVLHKASLQRPEMRLGNLSVDSIENSSDMLPIFLESDPLQLGKGSSQAVTPTLAPVTRNNWDIKRSFSSRFHSNPPKKLRPSYLNLNNDNGNNIYDLDSKQVFDPGYDPLELEAYLSTDDRGQTFALKIWLDPNVFSRARFGKVEICQASHGVKCLSDSPSHHGV
jgi:hypothetical protein